MSFRRCTSLVLQAASNRQPRGRTLGALSARAVDRFRSTVSRIGLPLMLCVECSCSAEALAKEEAQTLPA
jgi:hypothetical protein